MASKKPCVPVEPGETSKTRVKRPFDAATAFSRTQVGSRIRRAKSTSVCTAAKSTCRARITGRACDGAALRGRASPLATVMCLDEAIAASGNIYL